MQSIDSVKPYTYRTSKGLIYKKEKTKCHKIITQCKKLLTLIMLQRKTWKNIIHTGHKFMNIHTEY